MSRLTATLLLLTLVAGYYLMPIQAKAQTATPLVFDRQIELTLPHGPFRPTGYQPPKPKPQVKVTASQAKRGVPTGYNACSCVSYAKYKTGFTQSIGAARNWPVNSQIPTKGAVIVTYESRLGHVGIVSHWDDTYVYLESEANYSRCKMTYGRKILLTSKIIKGYWK